MIISIEQFKNIYPNTTISDDKLKNLICAVENMIVSRSCADTLEYEQDFTEIHRGNDSRRLYFCKPNIKQIKNIYVNDTLLDKNSYFENLKQGYIELYHGVFPKGMDIFERTVEGYTRSCIIKAELEGGYTYPSETTPDLGDVPCDLVNAISALINAFIDYADNSGLKSYKISDISYTFKSIEEQTSHLWFIIMNII